MAFFIDSSQSYTTSAEALRRYTGGGFGSLVAVPDGYGVGGSYLYKSFGDVGSNQVYVGEFLQFSSANPIWVISSVGIEQVKIHTLPNGAIRASQESTVLGTSAADVIRYDTDTWYYIEADIIIHGSAGQVKVYVDGALVLDLTGIDTTNPAAGATTYNWDTVQRGGSGFQSIGANFYLGDASVLAGPLGPIVVDRVLMAADSAVQFTPNAGANWSNVNDAAPDDDTTHNASSTVDQIDLFTPAAIDTDDTILAFQVGVQGRRTGAGVATLQTAVKQGGATDLGTAGAVGATYSENSRTAYYATLPDGSTPLSDAGFGALKFGYKKAS
jgi:hypothetical protein